jgi:hypothetical protein
MISLILNRLGFERHLSRTLAFGPRHFGSLGLHHLQHLKIYLPDFPLPPTSPNPWTAAYPLQDQRVALTIHRRR